MMTMQQYCLRWNNHQPNFISVFSSLLNSESLVDVTLAAEGRHLQAHKVVLSACSSYFQSLFTINPCQHPIVILKDVKFLDLKIMVDFMYYGEVNVSQDQLPHILKTAEMLKIKGLAEIPMDQSMGRLDASLSDRAELLTTGESNWNNENAPPQSLSPSPCPPSPSYRRKRIRKSSTGSGSGSLEKTLEEGHLNESTPAAFNSETVIKSESSFNSESSIGPKKQSSTDSDLHRGSSHESTDSNTKQHHITLQVSQQDYPTHHSISEQALDVERPSTSSTHQTESDKPTVTTHAQLPQQFAHHSQLTMGTKRGRFLMRQQRVKRENEGAQPSDNDFLSGQYLTVPPIRMERQCSDPLPTTSPPPGNLLAIPGSVLMKQHSHPLLLSQSRSYSPPAILPPFMSSANLGEQTERAISPVVVVTDPLSVSQELPLTGDHPVPSTTLRVRTDELRRSSSSPHASTRSSHCPAVRPGPALGCNYCWNTNDARGRTLRRKTKYHCPECQINLCIVPCFQEYHERHLHPDQTDPIALTTSVMRVFPKTTTM
ncbi:hypothetical protein WA026_014730 [Henosepilachna vigintioctopunctata]|uniref:BTB domain-containing protein n=1 Tax=Henosepilachna vigintioctopunctata TaxID=420089 RepID=A0AAW1VD62_9CUCU